MKMQWAMKLPEAWRLLRAGLKKDKSLGYMLLSIFICVLIVGFVIMGNTNPFTKYFDQEKAITDYILGICLYYSVLWLALVPMAGIQRQYMGIPADRAAVRAPFAARQTSRRARKHLHRHSRRSSIPYGYSHAQAYSSSASVSFDDIPCYLQLFFFLLVSLYLMRHSEWQP